MGRSVAAPPEGFDVRVRGGHGVESAAAGCAVQKPEARAACRTQMQLAHGAMAAGPPWHHAHVLARLSGCTEQPERLRLPVLLIPAPAGMRAGRSCSSAAAGAPDSW